jgi:hypothetical protein
VRTPGFIRSAAVIGRMGTSIAVVRPLRLCPFLKDPET